MSHLIASYWYIVGQSQGLPVSPNFLQQLYSIVVSLARLVSEIPDRELHNDVCAVINDYNKYNSNATGYYEGGYLLSCLNLELSPEEKQTVIDRLRNLYPVYGVNTLDNEGLLDQIK